MAMRFGHRICSNVRINKFSGVPTSLRGRSYCSEALSQLPVSSTAFTIAKVASPCAIWGGLFYYYDFLGFRTMIEKWKAEMKILEMVKRLNRETDLWDTMMYYREVVILKLLLEETRDPVHSPDKESNTPQAA